MRWLLHGNLSSAAVEAMRRHGQQVVTPAEIDLPANAAPDDVLKAADLAQLDILTADGALADAPFALDRWFQRTVVWVMVQGDVEQDDAIDRLFARYKRLSGKRLYTLTPGRVKIRQLPGRP